MAFDTTVTTNNVPALLSKLAERGINCLLWNAGACAARGPVKAELGFESKQDLMAAQEILGMAAA